MEKKLDVTTLISIGAFLLTTLGGVLSGIATKRQMKSEIAAAVAKAVTEE